MIPIELRVNQLKLNHMFKIINNQAPKYHQISLLREQHNLNTRYKKYSGLDHVWKKYLGSIHWKKNVCPLSMKRKCLPSIHEKKMSALYIHENKMLALYKWYCHGSRTNLIFVSLSWYWWRNVGSYTWTALNSNKITRSYHISAIH